MKQLKYFAAAIIAVLFSAAFGYAQSKTDALDITTPFKAWLMQNEAVIMSSAAADWRFIEQITPTLSFMPPSDMASDLAQKKLWAVHRKFYLFLNEIQDIYEKARRYGNGKLAVLFKKHRPELYALRPLGTPGLALCTAIDLRQLYHKTFLKCLQLNPKTDMNLSERLNIAANALTDDETRMFYAYLDVFSALYTGNKTAKFIKAFIQKCEKQQIAVGIKNLLEPNFSASAPAASDIDELDDPLAELEKLIGISGSAPTPAPSDSKTPNNQQWQTQNDINILTGARPEAKSPAAFYETDNSGNNRDNGDSADSSNSSEELGKGNGNDNSEELDKTGNGGKSEQTGKAEQTDEQYDPFAIWGD